MFTDSLVTSQQAFLSQLLSKRLQTCQAYLQMNLLPALKTSLSARPILPTSILVYHLWYSEKFKKKEVIEYKMNILLSFFIGS